MSEPSDDTALGNLRNIGPSTVRLLADLDIHTAGDVRHLGIPLVMHLLRQRGTPPSMNLAYALHAGLRGEHWLSLDDDTKHFLREACREE